MINIVSFLTSLYAGFAVFSIIGFMAKDTGLAIENVIKSGMCVVKVCSCGVMLYRSWLEDFSYVTSVRITVSIPFNVLSFL